MNRPWVTGLATLLPILVAAGIVVTLTVGGIGPFARDEPVSDAPPAVGVGVGDPYYPDAGAPGWDAQHYAIRIDWDPREQQLTATTTITAVATTALTEIGFDLYHEVTAASVNGAAAVVPPGGPLNRTVVPERPMAAGEQFTLEVSYAGSPSKGDGFASRGEEALFAGEPQASALWYPANDHPTDPATVEVWATVPEGMEAISNGTLVSRDTDADPDTATWHWAADEPMATYLAFLALGEFELRESDADGRAAVYAVSERLADRDELFARLGETPDIIHQLEVRYGPYPFDDVGGVVVDLELGWAALETQERPVYALDFAGLSASAATDVIVHEQVHQWFGNQVRVADWSDIVNNEGWATFAAAEVRERRTGQSVERWLVDRWTENDRFWGRSLSDPGIGNMFGTTYVRGGMALAALRVLLGDDEFFRIARAWAQEPGARSLADWQSFVENQAGHDLTDFWEAWYEAQPGPPPQERAYGWPD
ncbi:MAG: M1 family aminopeptidase [Propioniciclava sp.]